jgi:hypothetical protein
VRRFEQYVHGPIELDAGLLEMPELQLAFARRVVAFGQGNEIGDGIGGCRSGFLLNGWL